MHRRLLEKKLLGTLEPYSRTQSLQNPHTLLSPATIISYNLCRVQKAQQMHATVLCTLTQSCISSRRF
jgi:hypothetical protein